MTLVTGTRLGSYEILAPLGAGGMGEVYRARDTKLDREVAIKVLPESVAADPNALARFESEAKAVAALSHSNILAIFDFGRHEGVAYAVMELLQGETLRSRIGSGPLPLRRAVEFALQIAKGLSAAHDKGIVHRDLKPENLFVTSEGTIKILDFGLAKRAERARDENGTSGPTREQRTEPGTVMGTVTYMSPEQVRGEAVDHRSDVFSFGSVFYEMLTERKAFMRSSAAETMAAVLGAEPPEMGGAIPSAVADVVRHCLEKKAERRFQSARDLVFTLQQLVSGAHTVDGGIGAGGAPTVAVLPFRNFSADPENEFFTDGITEDVITSLSKVRSLKVISRTSVMAFKSRELSLGEIGKTLGAGAILEGSVRRAGNRVRIVAQLVDARTDENLWAETYDRELTDIFAIQTDVALQIAGALRAELSPDERNRLEKKPVRNVRAYQLYLQGRYAYFQWTDDSYAQALALLEQAVAEDPELALAHVSLALIYSELGAGQGAGLIEPTVAYGKAKAAVEKALELDPELGDAHGVSATLRFMCDYDWTGAEAEFRLALKLSPGSADIYDRYGWFCSALERYDESIRLVKRAQELDPLAHRTDLSNELLRAGRYQEALDLAAAAVALDPRLTRGHALSGWAHMMLGHHEEGVAALERAAALSPDSTLYQAQLGQALAMSGRAEDAREILRKMHALAGRRYVAPYHFAYVHTGLGEQDAALDWLEKAYDQKAGAIYGIKGSFLFLGLRSHPRFQGLLRKMNLA